ncbi:toxin-activating lysine-acyltransferase [Mesobacterium sp. TK19101]|uniref:RTX toxin-activating lysine-acyltransferase n=1 Tax=Mesobacterium hydrothermale TaxID=3111907 RepID=A0ABU6HLP2_9RHOB|nr:toxin-activating lysine-acyltransferase [Mesobacterium sp. TK19101]MEC3863368.1 toxin-activating lysine-acyltransferase [Mesobacterium sp. TK19101]
MTDASDPKPQGPGTPPEIDPAMMARIAQMRDHVRQSFGHAVMAMMGLPRYRHQSIMDLTHLVLEPLIRDRIALAHTKSADGKVQDVAGMAIWASVSEEADARIREQIKAGVFPVRLKPEDWNSGDINWLLDVLASDRKTAGAVIANFRQVVKEGDLRLHPIIARLVDKDMLDKMTRTAVQEPT